MNELRTSYDFIVIGAGIGGSVVAHRLAMDPSYPRVLLLEAGDKADTSGLSEQMTPIFVQLNQLTDIDWKYRSQKSNGSCCEWHKQRRHAMPRGKVMGGSGALNYMMWVRGNRDDWDVLMDVDGWKWHDVLPFYKKIETLRNAKNDSVRGYDGPIIVHSANDLKSTQSIFEESVIAACKSVGIQYLENGQNNGDNIGIAFTEYNVDDNGQRNNAFVGYNKYMRTKYKKQYDEGLINLDILPNAYAVKILFGKTGYNKNDDDDQDVVAKGVRFVDLSGDDKKEYDVRVSLKGEVILSGGSINSPQLLLLSGIGPKEELIKHNIDSVKELSGVGLNLQDHVMSLMRYHYNKDWLNQTINLDLIDRILNDFQLFKEYLFEGTGYLATTGANVNGFIKSNYSTTTYPDLQLYFMSGFDGNTQYMNYRDNVFTDHECGDKEFWTDPDNMHNIVAIVGLQHVASKGYIRLQSNDPFDHPLIQPNYLKEQEDVNQLKYGVRTMENIMKQSPMKRFWDKRMDCNKYGNIADDDDALEQYIRDSILNIYHPIGTCKMGDIDKDNMAVVDNKLKVKGIKNLRVADASILPHLTSGNTQLPTFMIGERASHFILSQWNKWNSDKK